MPLKFLLSKRLADFKNRGEVRKGREKGREGNTKKAKSEVKNQNELRRKGDKVISNE